MSSKDKSITNLEIIGPIRINPKYRYKIVVFPDPMNKKSAKSNKRYDLGVLIYDGIKEKRTSNIMTGGNNPGLFDDDYDSTNIKPKTFISAADIKNALEDYIKNMTKEQKIVCISSNEIVNPPTFVDDVMDATRNAGEIILSDSDKNTQRKFKIEVQKISTKGKNDQKTVDRGILFNGNTIKLPNGNYVSIDEFKSALEEYMLYKPKEPVPIPIPDPVYIIARRVTTDIKLIILAITMAAISLLGFGKGVYDVIKQKIIDHTNLSYTIEHQYTDEVLGDRKEYDYSDLTIGDSVNISNGIVYYESSDPEYGGADKEGTFGNEIRSEGKYTADGISVIVNGKIYDYTFESEVNALDFINQVCDETGVSLEDVIVRVHVGGPVSGWVEFTDLVLSNDGTPQVVGYNVVVDKTYIGTKKDFQGDSIDVEYKNNIINVPITDSDGNLLPNGTVVNVDGEDYKIVSLEKNTTQENVDVVVDQDSKINYDIKRITEDEKRSLIAAALLLTGLTITAGIAAYTNRNNRETLCYKNDQEFQKARDDFEKNSIIHARVNANKSVAIRPFIKFETFENMNGNVKGKSLTKKR